MSCLPQDLTSICNIFGQAAPPPTDTPDHLHTFVTAFFDTGRDDWQEKDGRPSGHIRTVETYMERFGYLAKLPNPMVIFTEPRFAERVLGYRRDCGFADRTTVVTIDHLFEQPVLAPALARITERMFNPYFRRMLRAPELPEFQQPRYVFTVTLKPLFVQTAIALGLTPTDAISWIDFGYCRADNGFDASRPWNVDPGGKMHLFHVMALDDIPIFTVVRSGEMYFIANHMFGPEAAWTAYTDEMRTSFECLVECGLIDDEQTMMFMSWRRHPDRYALHPLPPKQWFSTLQRAGEAATDSAAELPRARACADRLLWLEEIRYALARSALRAAWTRTRRAIKAHIRRLMGRNAGSHGPSS